MSRVTKAQATWKGHLADGEGSASLESSGLGPFTVNWTNRAESQVDKVTNPEELIGAGLASCFSMALANAAGTNLADAWARQSLGRPLPALPDGWPGVRFLWTAGDLRRAVTERRGGLVADVASTLRWLPGARTSVWDARDVGPTLDLAASRLRRPASRASSGNRLPVRR